ncbi:Uncharacterized protein APZ42_020199 [Daphnia magna]|uniref:Uncharacterized protein n=1 Tax=Daphnia magna TaxID=35525 RepID=A0A164Y2C9_9CRUS|nr:Uncharacterized protein APZ42_020199 [Daphnia magna]
MDFVGNYHAIPCRHNRVMKTIEYISLRHYEKCPEKIARDSVACIVS